MGGKESRERRRQKRAASSTTSSLPNETELAVGNDGKNEVKKQRDSSSTIIKKKKKIAKPKHLKRKFEQLSQLDGEVKDEMLARLMKEQEALQRQKAKRSIAFEAKIQETVGSTLFNKEVFDNLISHGVSKSKIVEAIINETKPAKSKLSAESHRINTDALETPTISCVKRKDSTNKILDDVDDNPSKINNDIHDNVELISRNKIIDDDVCPKNGNATHDDVQSVSDNDLDLVAEMSKKTRRRGRGHVNKKLKESDPVLVPTEASEENINVPQAAITPEETISSGTKKKESDKRRCIGRKPVTDFVIGNTYNGKVIYVKPFGAFIDIGCHSDGFVHISRVQDDFVDDINTVLKEGDEVKARVVEVDRKGKRITLSLQSEAMMEREAKSLEERQKRIETKKWKKNKVANCSKSIGRDGDRREIKEEKDSITIAADSSIKVADNAQLSKAELKRQRKLERRLQRRIENEKSEFSS